MFIMQKFDFAWQINGGRGEAFANVFSTAASVAQVALLPTWTTFRNTILANEKPTKTRLVLNGSCCFLARFSLRTNFICLDANVIQLLAASMPKHIVPATFHFLTNKFVDAPLSIAGGSDSARAVPLPLSFCSMY
jgi:hypothetical protein